MYQQRKLKISLFTGDQNHAYVHGLTAALTNIGVHVDFIAGDGILQQKVIQQLMERDIDVTWYKLYENISAEQGKIAKVVLLLKTYFKILKYSITTDSKLFHIQWFLRKESIERLLLLFLFKILGKKIIFTAHNINKDKRDNSDSWFNQKSLSIFYSHCDKVVVHTNRMKQQLIDDNAIDHNKIILQPIGIFDSCPQTSLNREDAREKLNLKRQDKIMLFFGNIVSYKGIHYLLRALNYLRDALPEIKLVVAGSLKKESAEYWKECQSYIADNNLSAIVSLRQEFIPDEDVEVYFKAADVLMLPYTYIYQSGLLFLGYHYGIPIIASDVGSLREFICEGETGYIFEKGNDLDLAGKISSFFQSGLFTDAERTRSYIQQYAKSHFSWESAASILKENYIELSAK